MAWPEVNNRQDFIKNIEYLREGLRRRVSWFENVELDAYLEALAAYVLDHDRFDDLGDTFWRDFGEALQGAALYE